MRHVATVLVLAALAPVRGEGQVRWFPEIGIQGGIARVKPAGTHVSDQTDLWDLPGDGSSYASLFAIIPVSSRLAVEPSLSASQFSFGEADGLFPFVAATTVTLTLRGDVALVSGLYAAAGGTALYSESGGEHDTQFGVAAAVGYRAPVSPRLTARLEAQGTSLRRTDLAGPLNLYALLFGISRSAGRAVSEDHALSDAPPAHRWRRAIGMAGGYVRTHLYGNPFGIPVVVDQTMLALPGSGSTTPPTLYVVVPLHGRFALETGFDVHRQQESDTTFFDGHVSARLNVATGGGWYGAAGGNVRYVKQTGTPGFAFAGANVAIGYRFPLMAELGGRVELNYTLFKERQNFPLAQNSIGVMFGVMMLMQ